MKENMLGEFFHFYKFELYWMCDQIIRKSNGVFDKHPRNRVATGLIADIETLDSVFEILSCASRIKGLLWAQTNPNKKGYNKLYCERAKYFQDLLRPLNLSEIMDKKVRNSVEHFEEYLDEKRAEYAKNKNKVPRCQILFNVVVQNIQPVESKHIWQLYRFADLTVLPFKVYVADERKFYNVSYSIDLEKVAEEAKSIMLYLTVLFNDSKPSSYLSGFKNLPGKESI